jgi:hypothetical protein
MCTIVTVPVNVAAQPVPVAAQSIPAPAPTSLRLALSTFGGYDTDITGTAANAETAPDAPHGGAMASLEYSKRTDRITFSSGGSADTRYYVTDDPFPAASYFGSALFGAEVTSRFNVNANVDAAYSPQIVFSPLPIPGDIETDLAPPTLDYGIAPQRMVSYAAGGNAAFRVSRHATLRAMLSSSSQRFLDDDYSVRSLSYGGGYSHSVSRYASLRLGYAQQDTDYAAFETTPVRRYTQRTYDVGVDYSRPLSLSRKTTFSFGTGSAVLDNGVETFFNVTGSASLSHQIGRTWEANVVYARGLGTVAGFLEPTFSDSVNANLQGHLNSRTTFTATGGYANGNVGVAAVSNDYDSFQATTRLEWDVQRDRTAIYASYYYYGYEYDEDTPTVVPMPSQIGRHGAQAGMIFRFPLIRERGSRVTR